jgi:hypothetical protein
MQFVLTGFKQDTGFRVFGFEGVAADQTRTAYTIRADLALTQKHGIRMQELPLLCRGLLERSLEGEHKRSLTFTEADMIQHARNCADVRSAAIEKRKTPRRHLTEQVGSGWRAPHDTKTAPVQVEQLLGSA